jgi:hypothetical protein
MLGLFKEILKEMQDGMTVEKYSSSTQNENFISLNMFWRR